MENIEYRKARVRLGFFSLVSLCSFVGFCSGIIFIPISFVYVFDTILSEPLWMIFAIIVGLPVSLAIQSGIMAIIGYPVYKLITDRWEFLYEGKFSIGKGSSTRNLD